MDADSRTSMRSFVARAYPGSDPRCVGRVTLALADGELGTVQAGLGPLARDRGPEDLWVGLEPPAPPGSTRVFSVSG
jgi:hypothetical protein